MRLTCPSCAKAFTLDETKLPALPAALKCPSCGGAIPVPSPKAAEAEAERPVASPAPAAPADPPVEMPSEGSAAFEALKRQVAALVLGHLGVEASRLRDLEDDGDVPFEKTALVCEDEALFQVAISEALEKLGFQVETAKDKKESLEALGRKSFGLVTVDNRFPDDAEGGYAILQQINAMNPEVRRRMTVAFISADLSTMDTQSAFILGANLTVSKKDVRRLDQVLLQGIREHRNAYKVFQEVQEEILRSTL